MNNEWQPIATAPKDGTVILCKEAGGFIVTCRYWSDEFQMNNIDGIGYVTPDEAFWGVVDPKESIEQQYIYSSDWPLEPVSWMPL